MLTGVETAGLVLAVFPILFHALEGYKKSCQPIHDWRHLPRVLRGIMQRFDVLELFLEDHIRKLLHPLLDSDAEVQALYRDPEHPKWKAPTLDQALHDRLGSHRFDKYFETVTDTYESMQKVLHILDVKGKVRLRLIP